jgi:23S rRNA (cytidine1920-2'-O)/16S rRNA (cytidine1409-2'-O)-methyltransferase
MTRLDTELVRRGLATTRTRAAALVAAGRVRVDDAVTRRVATSVHPQTRVEVVDPPHDEPDLASRAGGKLTAALRTFAVPVAGRRCLDAGASTGGFTDVLLRAGAARVYAVDVGHGQLLPQLAADPRVIVREGCNIRTVTPPDLDGTVSLTVADVSFIPLGLVLPVLAACTDQDLLVLVKPQFEVGREQLGRGGVVRDPELHHRAVHDVAATAIELGLSVAGAMRSPVVGRNGNVEAFLWLDRRVTSLTPEAAARVLLADGPVLAVRR